MIFNNRVQDDFKNRLAEKAKIVNDSLRKIMLEQTGIEPHLKEAMEYMLFSEGKRLRGALVLWCCEVTYNGSYNEDALVAAVAIEMVHTYSLVHDDLPAMDDDDMRRGQPACHIKFDEPTAILAGDALLTLAFEIMAKQVTEAAVSSKMTGQLAEAAGASGMITGQMADLLAEKKEPDAEYLEYIHKNKTAKMFRAACQLGALAGKANLKQMRDLSDFGLKLGLSFQIADDILDIESTTKQLGKTAGKDEKSGKMTYPALVGIDEAKKIEEQLVTQAINDLEDFDISAEILRDLAKALLERTK